MPRVFVVQEPTKYDHEKQMRVPIYDLSPAAEYGEIVVMLPSGTLAQDTNGVIDDLKLYLDKCGPNDYLLCAGNPTAIAMAAAIMADNTEGLLQTLEWDRKGSRYIVRRAQVW